MLLKIHPQNPEPRKLLQVLECIKAGGIIIFPTDTLYAIGCSIFEKKSIEKICTVKQINPSKQTFSFLCNSISQMSTYTKSIPNTTFQLIKKHTPGPYTFILDANKEIPHIFQNKKKTIGMRIPNNLICNALLELTPHPLLSTSLPNKENYIEEYTNPEIIYQYFGNFVDIVIDGGIGGYIPSTIINCIHNTPEVIRQGAGIIDF